MCNPWLHRYHCCLRSCCRSKVIQILRFSSLCLDDCGKVATICLRFESLGASSKRYVILVGVPHTIHSQQGIPCWQNVQSVTRVIYWVSLIFPPPPPHQPLFISVPLKINWEPLVGDIRCDWGGGRESICIILNDMSSIKHTKDTNLMVHQLFKVWALWNRVGWEVGGMRNGEGEVRKEDVDRWCVFSPLSLCFMHVLF